MKTDTGNQTPQQQDVKAYPHDAARGLLDAALPDVQVRGSFTVTRKEQPDNAGKTTQSAD